MAAEIRRQYDETRYQYAVSYEVPGGADPDASASAAVGRSGVGLSISASGRPRAAAPAVADASEVGNSREELFNQGEAEFRGRQQRRGGRVVPAGPRARPALGPAAVQAGAGLAQPG